MNYELIMLNGAKRMYSAANECFFCAKQKAVHSFYRAAGCEGTLAQMEEVSRLMDKGARYMAFCKTVAQALKGVVKPYRALLVQAYIRKIPKSEICAKYRVSQKELYRELRRGRNMFRNSLRLNGADERWFYANFGDIGWMYDCSRSVGRPPM